MPEQTPATNVERARAYLRALENRVGEEELATFFTPDVEIIGYPNRLVPKLARFTLADAMQQAAQGKKSVSRQSYTPENVVASGNSVAM